MSEPALYILSDGKPGHLAQTRGLAAAIGRQVPVQVTELAADRASSYDALPIPGGGLILAAGRRTYAPALRLRNRLGLPAVALMNPGWLMRGRFNLCVIPRHDGVRESARVLVTEGALNGIVRSELASQSEGLILIGGPSKHHGWDEATMREQLQAVVERSPDVRWTVTGSRRTPEATDRLLGQLAERWGERFVYTPAAQTPRGWVAEQLQRCGVCWVSEDSVSMVYESLTAGARVGLLTVPQRSSEPGRVVRGVHALVERGWVVTHGAWLEGKPLPEDLPPLQEAQRVACIIIERWLKAATLPG